ncbi:MAG: chromate transporter [Betaproteobacteria bacterium]|nr:chromate transporter [Betaproteobacteria bacterium]
MIVVELFLEFALLSFVAFGGATALLPEMHRVVVEHHHWLDDTTFTHLYAIAQAAPGPNVLVVTLIGWKVAGLGGALATTLGMCLPMSVVIYLLIDRWHAFAGKRWQQAVSLGVAPLAVGLVFSGATLIANAAGLSLAGWLAVAVAAVANLRFRSLHPLWLIAAGAALGAAAVI